MYSENFVSWRDNVQQRIQKAYGFQFTIEDIDSFLCSFDEYRHAPKEQCAFMKWRFSEAQKLIGNDKPQHVLQSIGEAIADVVGSYKKRFLEK